MQTIRIVVGWLLIGISGLAVIQTARAIALWEIAAPRYIERSRHENTITFAGRTVEVSTIFHIRPAARRKRPKAD